VTLSRRNGRHVVQRYKTKEARDYQAAVKDAARAAGFRPIKKPRSIIVRLAWYREARRGDLDNRLKVVLDALQGAMYDNDSQIAAIYAHRREDPRDPRIEVSVEPAA
jgi:Holliday junction resolvase RusA-like endonuclease